MAKWTFCVNNTRQWQATCGGEILAVANTAQEILSKVAWILTSTSVPRAKRYRLLSSRCRQKRVLLKETILRWYVPRWDILKIHEFSFGTALFTSEIRCSFKTHKQNECIVENKGNAMTPHHKLKYTFFKTWELFGKTTFFANTDHESCKLVLCYKSIHWQKVQVWGWN